MPVLSRIPWSEYLFRTFDHYWRFTERIAFGSGGVNRRAKLVGNDHSYLSSHVFLDVTSVHDL